MSESLPDLIDELWTLRMSGNWVAEQELWARIREIVSESETAP